MRKIAQEEAEKTYKLNATKYGVAKVPLHRHNGADSPRIRTQDIEHNLASTGSITMSTDGTAYRIGLNAKPGSGVSPSQIRFNGIVVNSTSSPTIRAIVVGDAYLGRSFYNQPNGSTAVDIGGAPQIVIQSSSYLMVNDSGSGSVTRAQVSEGHIVSVTSPVDGTVVARATIPDLGYYNTGTGNPIQAGALIVEVELASGWHIIGNWVLI